MNLPTFLNKTLLIDFIEQYNTQQTKSLSDNIYNHYHQLLEQINPFVEQLISNLNRDKTTQEELVNKITYDFYHDYSAERLDKILQDFQETYRIVEGFLSKYNDSQLVADHFYSDIIYLKNTVYAFEEYVQVHAGPQAKPTLTEISHTIQLIHKMEELILHICPLCSTTVEHQLFLYNQLNKIKYIRNLPSDY